jgi:hypothetical protein
MAPNLAEHTNAQADTARAPAGLDKHPGSLRISFVPVGFALVALIVLCFSSEYSTSYKVSGYEPRLGLTPIIDMTSSSSGMKCSSTPLLASSTEKPPKLDLPQAQLTLLNDEVKKTVLYFPTRSDVFPGEQDRGGFQRRRVQRMEG